MMMRYFSHLKVEKIGLNEWILPFEIRIQVCLKKGNFPHNSYDLGHGINPKDGSGVLGYGKF